jgi:hypothetical protein
MLLLEIRPPVFETVSFTNSMVLSWHSLLHFTTIVKIYSDSPSAKMIHKLHGIGAHLISRLVAAIYNFYL